MDFCNDILVVIHIPQKERKNYSIFDLSLFTDTQVHSSGLIATIT